MNHKTRRLVNIINESNEIISDLCNARGSIYSKKEDREIYVCNGKLYKTKKQWEKALSKNDYEIEYDNDGNELLRDYRDKGVIDESLSSYVYEYFQDIIEENYYKLNHEEYSLYIGALLNQFYLSGLHTCVGDFDLSIMDSFISEERLKKYIETLYECIRSRVWLYSKHITEEIAKEKNIKIENGKKLSSILSDQRIRVFLPDIIYYEDHINQPASDLKELQDLLVRIEPEYRIGRLYECISSIKESFTNSSNRKNYAKYAGILGIDLYNHAIGTPKLFDVTFQIIGGKLELDTAFSEGFGLGIPYIMLKDGIICNTETGDSVIATKELIQDLCERMDEEWKQDSDFASYFDAEEEYIYTYNDVRKRMATWLELGEAVSRAVTNDYIQGGSDGVSLYDGMPFKEFFRTLVYESGRKEREIAKTVGFNETYTNAIINGKVKNPSAITLLTFAISLRLSYDKTQVLLRKAGYCVSERDDANGRKERMLADYIINRIYDITRINEELDASGLAILGAKEK